MEQFPDLEQLSDAELDSLLRSLESSEDEISNRRRHLHGSIDALRQERVERLKQRVAAGTLDLPAPDHLERPIFQGSGDLPADSRADSLPDMETLSDGDLHDLIGTLERREDDISLERRVVHGRIDIVRAERARRMRGGKWDPDALSRLGAGGE